MSTHKFTTESRYKNDFPSIFPVRHGACTVSSTYQVNGGILIGVRVSPTPFENGSCVLFNIRDWSIKDLSQYNKIVMTRLEFEFLLSEIGENGGTCGGIKTSRIDDGKLSIESLSVVKHDTNSLPTPPIFLSYKKYNAVKEKGLKILHDIDIMLPYLRYNELDRPIIQDTNVLMRILLAVANEFYNVDYDQLDEAEVNCQSKSLPCKRERALHFLQHTGLAALNWALKSRHYKQSPYHSIEDIIPDLNHASTIVIDSNAHDPIAYWFTGGFPNCEGGASCGKVF